MDVLFSAEAAEKKSIESGEDSEAKDITDDDRIADLGKPRLGEITKCRVRIKESMEFKVCFSWINLILSLGHST